MNKLRPAIVAGNWKMNTTLSEAERLARDVKAATDGTGGVTVVVCPPFVSLNAVRWELDGSSLHVGAQNLHPEPGGAFTGEVSPTMLSGLSEFVIVGHSERRAQFNEDDEFVNRKVQAALAHYLIPIVCVGETLEENEGSRTEQIVERQVRGALFDVANVQEIVIAYEPVWAIGTGRAASAEQANETMAFIRQVLADMYGGIAAEQTRILYGGSVSPQNAGSLFRESEIDGALVGGASLNTTDFAYIVQQAALVAGRAARQ